MGRPLPMFHRFIGQKPVVDLLKRQLAGAKARGEPFPHALFVGPSGVGKTELAKALATEYESGITLAHGYDTVGELITKFKDLKPFRFLFIDEAHNLLAKAQECLYQVIDNNCLLDWEETRSGSTQVASADPMQLPPITVLLATDQPGKLLNALQKRMELVVRLGYYTPRELKEIVDRMASNLGLLISPQASNEIAQLSGGLPRNARHHLSSLRRHFPDAESRQLGVEDVREYRNDFSIDEKGLDKLGQEYLLYLSGDEPASLDSIALHLGMDAEYVRRQLEPALKRLGLFVISTGGRRLTKAGREWVQNSNQQGD